MLFPILCDLPFGNNIPLYVISYIMWSHIVYNIPLYVISHVMLSFIVYSLPLYVISHIMWSSIVYNIPLYVISHIMLSPIVCELLSVSSHFVWSHSELPFSVISYLHYLYVPWLIMTSQ